MLRKLLAAFTILLFVVSCADEIDPNQRKVFRISQKDVAKIQLRHLDAVNALRTASGLNPVELSSQLTAAAKTHAIDISRQNRPWHFGSDGSNPLERVARTGYAGQMVSENISETFENDQETLQAWMRDPVTRAGIMHPNARYLGFSWNQEPVGKIWWVQLFGS
ncbi:MAG: CAP domain-containing protein [Rhodobacteraceae bacterium]|nr:CAP domain-containing protein [Paracoccaceae bacterium]